MEDTISTEDLKAKLDRKENIKESKRLRLNATAKPTFPEH